jgi:hypothetical protein
MPKLSLLLLSALAACTTTAAPASPPPMSSPPPTAPMSMGGGFPVATYTTTIVAADVPSTASAEERAGVVGAWTIAFGSNGHATVSYNGRQVVDAPFQVSGNQLMLTDDSGEYACHSNARYQWHDAGTELHLIKVEDSCAGRVVALTAHPLVRQ